MSLGLLLILLLSELARSIDREMRLEAGDKRRRNLRPSRGGWAFGESGFRLAANRAFSRQLVVRISELLVFVFAIIQLFSRVTHGALGQRNQAESG